MLAGVLALLVLPTLASPASADAFTAPSVTAGASPSVQAYGRRNPACAEWTDGCVVCTSASGRAQCSTPGIACTPAGLTCKRHAIPSP